jgi:hypothetical protein
MQNLDITIFKYYNIHLNMIAATSTMAVIMVFDATSIILMEMTGFNLPLSTPGDTASSEFLKEHR